MFNTGGRRIVFYAIFGSHNYNLNTENSDKDYKVFVAPTFEDFYSNSRFSTSEVTPSFDYDVHDIRKLSDLFWKSNINFMEVLFSNELRLMGFFKNELQFFTQNKESIGRINLPYLYNACIGMYHQKKERMYGKGTESTKELVDKYGYECKEASHAYRVIDFLSRYFTNDFTSFKDAMYYFNDEISREIILNIKGGKYPLEFTEKLLLDKLNEVTKLSDIYKSFKPNESLKQEIDFYVKKMLRENLKEELNCQ